MHAYIWVYASVASSPSRDGVSGSARVHWQERPDHGRTLVRIGANKEGAPAPSRSLATLHALRHTYT